ncbi:MAG: hypothetical protein PW734_01075 [Verrucomicrobium sp.]|nr:hypothetical protein [Verrucomicrobium sp.]
MMNRTGTETLFLCDARHGDEAPVESLRAQGHAFLPSSTVQQDLLRLVEGEADLIVLRGAGSWSPSARGCLEVLAGLKGGCGFAAAEEGPEGWFLQPIASADVVTLLRQTPALADLNDPYEVPLPSSSLPGSSSRAIPLGGLSYRRSSLRPKKKAEGTVSGGGPSLDDEVDNKDSETVCEPILVFEGRAV